MAGLVWFWPVPTYCVSMPECTMIHLGGGRKMRRKRKKEGKRGGNGRRKKGRQWKRKRRRGGGGGRQAASGDVGHRHPCEQWPCGPHTREE